MQGECAGSMAAGPSHVPGRVPLASRPCPHPAPLAHTLHRPAPAAQTLRARYRSRRAAHATASTSEAAAAAAPRRPAYIPGRIDDPRSGLAKLKDARVANNVAARRHILALGC